MRLQLKMSLKKTTTGTFVYMMKDEIGREIGQVYLPKLIMPPTAPAELDMTLSDEGEAVTATRKRKG